MDGIGKHIVLIGFMGSGKTTVGKLLADAMNMEFVDIDSYIEKAQNMLIKEIFEKKGEAYFRKVESDALSELLNRSTPMVLSTGGGAPCYNNSMNLIKNNSISVYLRVGVYRLVYRLRNDNQRPLLQNKSDKELLSFVKSTLSKREKYYSIADIRIRAIDSPEKLTRRLTKYILKKNILNSDD